MYEDHTSHDQIPADSGPHGAGHRPRGAAGLLLEVLPARLHPASTLRLAGAARVPQARLPRPGADPPRVGRVARRPGPGEGPRPLHDPEGRRAAARKKGVDALPGRTVRAARGRGLIPPRPKAAIDATGFETRHVSRYFAWRSKRSGRRRRQRAWPKLTAVL